MSDPLLPRSVPLSLAAILLGRSLDKVHQLIDAGSLRTVINGKRRQIPLADIEAKIGTPLTPAAYCYAERQLDRQMGRA